MAESRLSPGVVRALIIASALISALLTHYVEKQRFDVREISVSEMDQTLRWLNQYYSSPEGLQRPTGLVTNGEVDYAAISVWVFQTYLQGRSDGATPEAARAAVARAIHDTPEWQEKHRQ